MKLVIAHDYLIQMGGAERVVAAVSGRHRRAPIYTSAAAWDRLLAAFRGADIRTSWMQGLPGIQHPKWFKAYAPLYPAAFRAFKPPDADCAFVSASTFAKQMRFHPETRTVCYLHNTTRFLWQGRGYLEGELGSRSLAALLTPFLSGLRRADRAAARRMNLVLANSANVRERILRDYGIAAEVLHPPVDLERFAPGAGAGGYYLVLSRLLAYKNIELPVRAFSAANKSLVVAGEGPDRPRLERLAGPSVRFAGRVSDDEARRLLMDCKALVFPGVEDFGITPLEAMACGRPVLALAEGGALETVVEGRTGVFFQEPTPQALLDAAARIEAARWDAGDIRRHAAGFSIPRFLDALDRLLSKPNAGDVPSATPSAR